MTKNKINLFEIDSTNLTVSGPLEVSKTISKEKGKIKLDCLINSTDSNPVIFGDVLLVPTLKKNLISVQ